MSRPTVYVLNLSRGVGGAEIYTHAFVRAVLARGWHCVLFISSGAGFWQRFDCGESRLVPVDTLADILAQLPAQALLVNHSSAPVDWLTALRQRARLVGVAHHALTEHNRYSYYDHSHRLLAVSEYVVDTLKRYGYANFDPVPLYGVANVIRQSPQQAAKAAPMRPAPLYKAGTYDWDRRKVRDRALSWVYPTYLRLRPQRPFVKAEGVTLGIVSRIAKIKQFPELFGLIAPTIARYPNVHIEVFGGGNFNKVRELKEAMRPIRPQVRWWGWQEDVAAVYRQLDWLLTGLPEREALGLNLIEAQMSGIPVLAVRAKPFSETVLDSVTGLLYTDPRQDGGTSFAAALKRIVEERFHPDPRAAAAHLARFSFDAFADRIDAALRRTAADLNCQLDFPQ